MPSTQASTYDKSIPSVPDGNGSPANAIPFIASEVKDRLETSERKELIRRFAKVEEVPFKIEEQHPLLRQYYKLVAPFLDAKPQVVITPLLPAMACNVGNHAYISAFGNNIYCNIWTIVMGPSSIARKTTCLDRTLPPIHDYDDELEDSYNEEMRQYKKIPEKERGEPPVERCILLPDSTTERFIEILQHNPNGLVVHAEIASFLTKMNKSYNGDFKSDITEWFDTPHKKKHQTMTRSTVIRRPCFSISTATTREWLVEQLNPKDLRSGFMQRFLICNAHQIDEKTINCRILPGKDAVKSVTNWLARLYHGLRQIGTEDYPKEIPLSPAATDLHEKINRRVLHQIFGEYDDTLFSYWSRIFTGYFLRLSLVLTLAEHVDFTHQNGLHPTDCLTDLEVTEATAAYALKLCHYYFQNIRAFLKSETTNAFSADEQKIMNVFYHNAEEIGPGQAIPRTYLRTFAKIRATREFNEALDSLLESGVLLEKRLVPSGSKSGKTSRFYQCTI